MNSAIGQKIIATAVIFFTFLFLSLSCSSKDMVTFSRFHHVWEEMNSLSYAEDVMVENLDDYDTIFINSSKEFNQINEQLQKSIAKGTNQIFIKFAQGEYVYNEGHISVHDIDNKSVSILLDGNNSVFWGSNELIYSGRNPINSYSIDGKIASLWSDVVQSDEEIQIVNDGDRKIFKVKKMPDVIAHPGDFIQISQWFRTSIYKIIEISDEYLFFDDSFLYEWMRRDWDVNYDLKYGKKLPRYRIFDASSDVVTEQHDPVSFFRVKNCSVAEIRFKNVNLYGSSYSANKGVIDISDSAAGIILIDSCNFEGCNSPCVMIRASENVCVNACSFNDNSYGCVLGDDRCVDSRVTNCSFTRNGGGWTNSFNVRLSGSRFLIADNVFSDFNYGAICVGDWWGNPKNGDVSGIVENNEIFYSLQYYRNYWKHTLMDGGAVYVMTKNDDIHIRYNRIYNIKGMKDYRGIFCDDGTCNVKIYGNVVTGIGGSNAIDLRYVPTVETNPNYDFGKVNIGNVLIYNFIDGGIKFEGRNSADNGCIKGLNFILSVNDNKQGESVIKNIQMMEDDYVLPGCLIYNDKGLIELSDSGRRVVDCQPIFGNIQKWFLY